MRERVLTLHRQGRTRKEIALETGLKVNFIGFCLRREAASGGITLPPARNGNKKPRPDWHTQVVQLHRQGHSAAIIAERLQLGGMTVRRVLLAFSRGDFVPPVIVEPGVNLLVSTEIRRLRQRGMGVTAIAAYLRVPYRIVRDET